MRLTRIEYKRLSNLGNFENETISASAEIEDGEDAAEAMTQLRRWVAERLYEAQVDRLGPEVLG